MKSRTIAGKTKCGMDFSVNVTDDNKIDGERLDLVNPVHVQVGIILREEVEKEKQQEEDGKFAHWSERYETSVSCPWCKNQSEWNDCETTCMSEIATKLDSSTYRCDKCNKKIQW